MVDPAQTPLPASGPTAKKSVLLSLRNSFAPGRVSSLNQATLPPVEPLPPQPSLPDPVAAAALSSLQADDESAPVDTLNPPHPVGGTVKEIHEPAVTLESPAVDVAQGVQYVETEKNAEIPPEVDGFIKKIENQTDQLPQEIVIADQQGLQPTTKYLAQPVIILPITPEMEKAGARKSSSFSLRWLVEWSRKLMKAFSGRIIYREVASS